jgi:NitT/TauT family transport system substrate-binding protein
LIARGEEAEVLALFAPIQKSPRCIMVHESSGIKSFDDLQNITIAMNQNSSFGAILKHKVPMQGCKFEPYPGTVAKFLLNKDFAQQGYVFSEPVQAAAEEGGDPHSLMAADIGFNPYTSVLIAHDDTVKNRTELVQKMVTACQKGWAQYLEDPTEANKLIHEDNVDMELKVLSQGANELKKNCMSGEDSVEKIGRMSQERWQAMLDLMIAADVMKKDAVDANAAFTTQFME